MLDYLISRINSFSLDTEGLAVNNLFERTTKKFIHQRGSDTLVICLPGWRQPLWSWGKVKKNILSSGASFLAYDFPGPILSDNEDLTRRCFELISLTVRGEIKILKERYGFSRVVLVSLSLSSSYASMIYKDSSDVSEIILVAPGENLARDMWYGCRTQHLRKSYEKQGVKLRELETNWAGMASENNMPAKGTKVTLYFSGGDKVIPYKFSKSLGEKFLKAEIQEKEKVYPMLGHYMLSYWFLLKPFNFLELQPATTGGSASPGGGKK